MKKTINLLLLMLALFNAKAQRATFKNDTARYNGIAYVVGDTLKLAAGSQPDKSFAFISMGAAQTELDKSMANTVAVIEKIYISRKTVYMNAKLIGKAINGDSKVLVDLEAAVDNKEIK